MVQQIIAILGFFLSFLLIYYNNRKKQGALYIGLFFLFLSVYSYLQYLIIFSQSILLISLIFLQTTFIGYLIGPMIYFYVRNSVSGDYRFRKSDLLHFLPALIMILASVRFYFLPWQEKMDVAIKLIEDRKTIWFLTNEYIGWLIPNLLNFIARPLFLLVYSCWSLLILFLFSKSIKSENQKEIQISNYRWLLVLLIFTLLLAFIQIILVLVSVKGANIESYRTFNVFQVISGIALVGIISIPFFNPSVLYGLKQVSATEEPNYFNQQESGGHGQETIVDEKVSGNYVPLFDSDYLRSVDEAVLACMESEKLYLQEECNLGYFSKIVNLPQHHLLYYFREFRKQSFNEFRNSWRIKHAKLLIEENKDKMFTMEAIGKMSGFSSKNAFFVSFKKAEGNTPGNFAANRMKES